MTGDTLDKCHDEHFLRSTCLKAPGTRRIKMVIIPQAYLEYFAPLSITDIIFTRLVHAQSYAVEQYYGHSEPFKPSGRKKSQRIGVSLSHLVHFSLISK